MQNLIKLPRVFALLATLTFTCLLCVTLDGCRQQDSFVPEDAVEAADDEQKATQDTLGEWSEKACELLRIYPATYIREETDEEPHFLELDEWASRCLQYVDPASDLGVTLQNDPASIMMPAGFIEAAVVVNDTTVTLAAMDGVVVDVDIEGTQQDWEHTVTYTETYLVRFGSDGLITSVERVEP